MQNQQLTQILSSSCQRRASLGALNLRRENTLGSAGVADEISLVSQARIGSGPAFEELVSRHGKKVYRLALRITKSPEDAEDVAQETFLKVFVHLSEFRGDSHFDTWIARIAVNEGLMNLRRRRSDRTVSLHEASTEEGRPVLPEFMDRRSGPEKIIARVEAQLILARTARALSPASRAVLFLRDVEEFSTKETAALLRMKVGTVKAKLSTTHAYLRSRLTPAFT